MVCFQACVHSLFGILFPGKNVPKHAFSRCDSRFRVLCVRMNHIEAYLMVSSREVLQSTQDGNLKVFFKKKKKKKKGKLANLMIEIFDDFSSV